MATNTAQELNPHIGVGVMIKKDNTILVGKRLGSHGHGEWAWPGGHLEHMESIVECAKREVMEETGMTITNVQFLRIYNLKEYAPKHYIDIGVTADWVSGEPQLLEPDRCMGWEWVEIDKVTALKPLFGTVPSMIDAYNSDRKMYDN